MLEEATLWQLVEARAAATPAAAMAVDEAGRALSFARLSGRLDRRRPGPRRSRPRPRASSSPGCSRPASRPSSWSGALARLDAIQNPILPIYRGREVRFIVGQARPALLVTPGLWRGFDYAAMAREIARSAAGLETLVVDRGLPGVPDLGASAGATPRPMQTVARPPYRRRPARFRPPTSPSAGSSTARGPPPTRRAPSTRTRASGPPRRAWPWASTCAPRTGSPSSFPSPTSAAWRGCFAGLGDRGLPDPDRELRGPRHDGDPPPPRRHPRHGRHGLPRGLSPGRPRLPRPAALPAHARVPGRRRARSRRSSTTTSSPKSAAPASARAGASRKRRTSRWCRSTIRPRRRPRAKGGPRCPRSTCAPCKSDGSLAGRGRIRELRVRAPQVCRGYLDSSLDAAAFDEHGYFRTGDLGCIDAEGYVVITGRLKDVIIRKGENIPAKEVEDLLYTHPKVAEVAVVGLPDPKTGERCCAVVVCRDANQPLELAEMQRFLRDQQLMMQKIPEQLELVDALPRNADGQGPEARAAGALRADLVRTRVRAQPRFRIPDEREIDDRVHHLRRQDAAAEEERHRDRAEHEIRREAEIDVVRDLAPDPRPLEDPDEGLAPRAGDGLDQLRELGVMRALAGETREDRAEGRRVEGLEVLLERLLEVPLEAAGVDVFEARQRAEGLDDERAASRTSGGRSSPCRRRLAGRRLRPSAPNNRPRRAGRASRRGSPGGPPRCAGGRCCSSCAVDAGFARSDSAGAIASASLRRAHSTSRSRDARPGRRRQRDYDTVRSVINHPQSGPATTARRTRRGREWKGRQRGDGRLQPVLRRGRLRRPAADLQAPARRGPRLLSRRVRHLGPLPLRGHLEGLGGHEEPDGRERHDLGPPADEGPARDAHDQQHGRAGSHAPAHRVPQGLRRARGRPARADDPPDREGAPRRLPRQPAGWT